MKMKRTNIALPVFMAALVSLLAGCANIGNPSGGPRDEDPPRLVSANPPPGSLGVNRTKMVLQFDELVNVKDAFSKVVVSPTSRSVPRVSSLGRKVTVEFDSLAPNTTYTVDFADAIEDNNEANTLQGFTYTFSTGQTLDSLRISGRVLGARDLEPAQGMLVGVHANLADSAFTTERLLRVAKTDDRGQFTIRGLAPGQYRVFALDDKDNDYRYANQEEDIAFYDMVISPTAEPAVANDTVYDKITGNPDTVIQRPRTRFLPNDVILYRFNSEKRPQYLTKYERLDSTRVFMKFNTRAESLPCISILGYPKGTTLGALEASEKLDSLVYWLRPELVRDDSLIIAARYMRTDSTGQLREFSDTLRFFTKKPSVKKHGRKEIKISAADSIARITTSFRGTGGGSSQEVWLPFHFESEHPIATFDTTKVSLKILVDSTYRSVATALRVLQADSLSPRHFRIEFPWEYEQKYRVEIDTMAAIDIYGRPTRPFSQELNVRPASEYCSLTLMLSGLDPSMPAFVELLGSGDKLERTALVENGRAYFPFLNPGKYYARMIEDRNGNGRYDTGDYSTLTQPETAFYYPKAFNIKKNWDKEETWDVYGTAIDQQKPRAILKNRPKQGKHRNRNEQNSGDEEEEEDGLFDPTRNPFDPNDRGSRNRGATRY